MGIFDFIARPFAQFLMFLYDLTGSYGLALLIFAAAVKVILLPFQMKAKKGTMKQGRLQPKLAEIQKKHGANRVKLNEEMQKMYKEEGVNPASGCIWGFLPLPILFALFQAIRQPITMMMRVPEYLIETGGAIYNRIIETGFIPTAGDFNIELDYAQHITRYWSYFDVPEWVNLGLTNIQFELFGLINLGQQPNWQVFWADTTIWSGPEANWLGGILLFLLPLLSGGAQFISAGIMRKTQPAMPMQQDGAGKQMQTMMLMMPLVSVFFGFTLPAALSFYWTIGTVLQIFQDLWLGKRYTKILDAEDEERNRLRAIKEAEIEAKRLETERKKAEGIVEENKNKSKRKKQISEKQERLEKSAEWEKKNSPPKPPAPQEYEPSREGKRRYARGRAYDPERYSGVMGAGSSSEDSDADVELDEVLDTYVNEELDVNEDAEAGDFEQEFDEEIDEESDDEESSDESDDDDYDDDNDDEVEAGEDEPEAEEAQTTVRFDTARFEEDKKD